MAYQYHRQITIDHTKVGEDLADYPFLFNSTLPELKTVANGGHVHNTATGGASGSLTVPADLVFSPNSDGSGKYDFEVEKYDPTTGELVAWVRIPSLSSSSDTTLYLCYGDSSVTTSQENVTGVWDSNFKAVWHLGESGDYPYDSTGGNNDVTARGGTPDYQQAGKIGYSVRFQSASSEYFSVPDSADFAMTDATFEAWVKAPSGTSHRNIVRQDDSPNTPRDLWLFRIADSHRGQFAYMVDGVLLSVTTAVSVDDDTWKYLVGVRDGTAIYIYLNAGTPQSATGGSSGTVDVADVLLIGAFKSSEIKEFFNGLIDEVRISSVARSSGYISTTYNNTSSPATFYSVAAEVAAVTRTHSPGASLPGLIIV